MPIADTLAQALNIWSNIFSWESEFILYFILGIVLVWILGIIWVAKDANERIENIGGQTFCIILATLLWPLWILFYKIFRPTQYKSTKEMKIDISQIDKTLSIKICFCEKCWKINKRKNNFCINCWYKIKNTCKECWTKINLSQNYCEECWAPNI